LSVATENVNKNSDMYQTCEHCHYRNKNGECREAPPMADSPRHRPYWPKPGKNDYCGRFRDFRECGSIDDALIIDASALFPDLNSEDGAEKKSNVIARFPHVLPKGNSSNEKKMKTATFELNGRTARVEYSPGMYVHYDEKTKTFTAGHRRQGKTIMPEEEPVVRAY